MDSEKKIFNYDSNETGHLGLPTGTFYGDDGNYYDKPTNVNTGHAPLDSLPASWWNYLWHYICDVQNCFYQDVDGVFDEITNAIKLGCPDIVFDPYDHTQLYKAIEYMVKAVATDETRGTIVSSNEYGKVSVDPETGIATANGVGDLTEIDDLFQPSTTLVQAFNKVITIINGYAPLYHPSDDPTTYGEGTDKLYGHTKLTDEISLTYDSSKGLDEEPNSSILRAKDSVGISPLAVSKIYSDMYNKLLEIARTSLPYENQIVSTSTTISVSGAVNYCVVTASDITVTVPQLNITSSDKTAGVVELYYTPTTSRKYATVKVPTSSSATESHVLCRLHNHITLYSDDSGYWHVPIEQQYTDIFVESHGSSGSDVDGISYWTVAHQVYRIPANVSTTYFMVFDSVTLDKIASIQADSLPDANWAQYSGGLIIGCAQGGSSVRGSSSILSALNSLTNLSQSRGGKNNYSFIGVINGDGTSNMSAVWQSNGDDENGGSNAVWRWLLPSTAGTGKGGLVARDYMNGTYNIYGE